MSDYIKKNKQYSIERIAEFSDQLQDIFDSKYSNKICIYATGSYARYEANEHSDLDVFIAISDKGKDTKKLTKIQESEIISGLENMRVNSNLQEFTDGGDYLSFHTASDLIGNLGNTKDDFENTFTARMLLLLESKPLYGEDNYYQLMRKITDAYFNDFHSHVDNFIPVFLVNDILRFWRTLCLNYESKRSYREDNKQARGKGHLQNLKLKFSRLLICFATIGYLAKQGQGLKKDDLIDMIKLPPQARFSASIQDNEEFQLMFKRAMVLYETFMKSMDATSDEISDWIMNKNHRGLAFKDAKEFGDIIYKIVFSLAEQSKVERFLVV